MARKLIWPCACASSLGSYRAEKPGAVNGEIIYQEIFEDGIIHSPVTDPEGNIVFASCGVYVKTKSDGRVSKQEIPYRGALLCLKDCLLVCCEERFVKIFPDGKTEEIKYSPEAAKISSGGVLEAVSEAKKIFCLTSSGVFCVDSVNLNYLWSLDLAANLGLSGKWRMISDGSGGVIIAGSFSREEHEVKESAAYLLRVSSAGEIIWLKEKSLDFIPSVSGNRIRLSVFKNFLWYSDDGLALYDLDGTDLWQEWDMEKPVSIIGLAVSGTPVFFKSGEVCTLILTSEGVRELYPLAETKGEFIDGALDSENNIYVLTTQGLHSFNSKGKRRFFIAGITGDKLCITEGYMAVVLYDGRLSILK